MEQQREQKLELHNAEIAGEVARAERIREIRGTEMEQMVANYQMESDILKAQQQERADAINGMAQLNGAVAGSFATMATALEQSGDKTSGVYKTVFATSKGFALAQSSLNLGMAVSQAYADWTAASTIEKFGLASAVAGSVGSVISQISSVTMAGRINGGNVQEGNGYKIAENEPEVFFPKQSGTVKTMTQMRSAMGGGSSGGVQPITVINNTSTPVTATADYNDEGQIRSIAIEEINRQTSNKNSQAMKNIVSNTSANKRYA